MKKMIFMLVLSVAFMLIMTPMVISAANHDVWDLKCTFIEEGADISCPHCNGVGWEPCSHCNGTGHTEDTCLECHGNEKWCEHCYGTGICPQYGERECNYPCSFGVCYKCLGEPKNCGMCLGFGKVLCEWCGNQPMIGYSGGECESCGGSETIGENYTALAGEYTLVLGEEDDVYISYDDGETLACKVDGSIPGLSYTAKGWAMNGFNFESNVGIAVYVKDSVTINLTGENRIVAKGREGGDSIIGIYAEKDLYFTGEGSLSSTAYGGDDIKQSVGIQVENNLYNGVQGEIIYITTGCFLGNDNDCFANGLEDEEAAAQGPTIIGTGGSATEISAGIYVVKGNLYNGVEGEEADSPTTTTTASYHVDNDNDCFANGSEDEEEAAQGPTIIGTGGDAAELSAGIYVGSLYNGINGGGEVAYSTIGNNGPTIIATGGNATKTYGIYSRYLLRNAGKITAKSGNGIEKSMGIYISHILYNGFEGAIPEYFETAAYGEGNYNDYFANGSEDEEAAAQGSTIIATSGDAAELSAGIYAGKGLYNDGGGKMIYTTTNYSPGFSDSADGEVASENTATIIATAGNAKETYGIYSHDVLSNDGKISAKSGCGTKTEEGNYVNDSLSAGIYVKPDMDFYGGGYLLNNRGMGGSVTVYACSEDEGGDNFDAGEKEKVGIIEAASGGAASAYGIYTASYLNNNGKITASSGNGTDTSMGIYVEEGLYNDNGGNPMTAACSGVDYSDSVNDDETESVGAIEAVAGDAIFTNGIYAESLNNYGRITAKSGNGLADYNETIGDRKDTTVAGIRCLNDLHNEGTISASSGDITEIGTNKAYSFGIVSVGGDIILGEDSDTIATTGSVSDLTKTTCCGISVGNDRSISALDCAALLTQADGRAIYGAFKVYKCAQLKASVCKDGTGASNKDISISTDGDYSVSFGGTTYNDMQPQYVCLTVCKYLADFTSGKQTLFLGGKKVGKFTITGDRTNGFSLKNEHGQYVVAESVPYDDSILYVSSYSDDESFKWKYDGGLYIMNGSEKQYLAYDVYGFDFSDSKVSANIRLTSESHAFTYSQCDGNVHRAVCENCGYSEEAAHTFNAITHRCICGKLNPDGPMLLHGVFGNMVVGIAAVKGLKWITMLSSLQIQPVIFNWAVCLNWYKIFKFLKL